MMWPTEPDWPGRIVPLVVNVLQHPLPKPARCYKLGKAVGKAIRSYPEDLRVAMVGTGGLSHQMIGERAGFNDETWDREFLDLIDRDPERLARMSIADFARRGGNEGAEVIMWLVMRGALNEGARKVHESYYLPMTTAMAQAHVITTHPEFCAFDLLRSTPATTPSPIRTSTAVPTTSPRNI